MIDWAFLEYFKTGTFPPKPADISALIRGKREAMSAEIKARDNFRQREGANAYANSPDWADIRAQVKELDRKLGFEQPSAQHTKEMLRQQAKELQK